MHEEEIAVLSIAVPSLVSNMLGSSARTSPQSIHATRASSCPEAAAYLQFDSFGTANAHGLGGHPEEGVSSGWDMTEFPSAISVLALFEFNERGTYRTA